MEFCHFKMLIFHWFYKLFSLCENAKRKPSLRNAFSMILEPIFGFEPKKYWNSIGFISFFESVFRKRENVVTVMVFWCFWSRIFVNVAIFSIFGALDRKSAQNFSRDLPAGGGFKPPGLNQDPGIFRDLFRGCHFTIWLKPPYQCGWDVSHLA